MTANALRIIRPMHGETSTPARRPRAAIHCALGFAVFVAVCLTLHPFLPWPEMDEISGKLAYFSRHKDEFDTIFLGSSRTYRGVFPKPFDAAMKKNGVETHSFNLAIDGMMVPESFFFLEKVLEMKPAGLKRVVCEMTPFRVKIDPVARGMARSVYWHDWLRLKWLLRDLWENPPEKVIHPIRWLPKPLRPWQLAVTHINLCLKNYGNLGRGFDFLNRHRLDTVEAVAVLEKSYGTPRFGCMASYRKGFMDGKELRDYETKLAKLRTGKPTKGDAGPGVRKSTARAVELIRQAGAEPVFMITTTLNPTRDFFPNQKDAPRVLPFNDPARYPLLYQVDHRVDAEHLNNKGAKEFTLLLAEELAGHFAEPR